MNKYLLSISLGATLFVVGIVTALAGYGYVLVYGQLFVILAILAFVAVLTFRRKRSSLGLYLSNCVIVLLLGVTGLASGSWALLYNKRGICAECDKVLSALEKHKAQNGRYPENLSDINFGTITSITIQQGKFLESGIDVADINATDATIYLSPNGYLCLVPVTQVLPMSFTRFYVLEKNNTMTGWKYQKLIWLIWHIE